MKWNKQRIAAVLVLAIAGGAFCVDRFVIGYTPPAAVAAEPAHAAVATAAATAPARVTAATPNPAIVRTVSLTQRMSKLGSSLEGWPVAEGADAMVIPAAWIPPKTAEAAPGPDGRPAVEFPDFTLFSVYAASNGSDTIAVINRKILRVGQVIDGYALQQIEAGAQPPWVRLSGPAGELKLEVKAAQGSPPVIPARNGAGVR